MEVLAVVQARGGSKGLPNKNLRPILGHPLIAYSVASAHATKRVTRTIVSTDSAAIADIARAYCAEVPFRRPPSISGDTALDLPVFEHALEWLWENERYRPDLIVQLRPTSPLRPKGLIDEAIEILSSDPNADCVRAVTTPKQTPYKMWRQDEDGTLHQLLQSELSEPYNMPRQLLPSVFWQTGHVDVIRTSTILDQHTLTGRRVRPIIVDSRYCIDIDSSEDLEAASQAIAGGTLDLDLPAEIRPQGTAWLPHTIELVAFDFDGVFTDNRVHVLDDGGEAVTCHRGDGLGISLLQKTGLPLLVLSTESSSVVKARCQKLAMECFQGVGDKLSALKCLADRRGVRLANTVYVGNDVNDLACLRAVGCAVVPRDAHPDVRAAAHWVLASCGGCGAVRELCDLILAHLMRSRSNATSS